MLTACPPSFIPLSTLVPQGQVLAARNYLGLLHLACWLLWYRRWWRLTANWNEGLHSVLRGKLNRLNAQA